MASLGSPTTPGALAMGALPRRTRPAWPERLPSLSGPASRAHRGQWHLRGPTEGEPIEPQQH